LVPENVAVPDPEYANPNSGASAAAYLKRLPVPSYANGKDS
jgi:hypothetical protein